MSVETLKQRLIPLIQRGYRDDVRCEILIHLKENPQDEEVWHWCVATARSYEDRLRAVHQWLRFIPSSQKALRVLRKIEAENAASPAAPSPQFGTFAKQPLERQRLRTAPFGAREFLAAFFTGQTHFMSRVSYLVEEMKAGSHHHLLFRAPSGWGKTHLADLILNYLDPQLTETLVIPGRQLTSPQELGSHRYVLVEEFGDVPNLETLVPAMEVGLHCFIFTSRSPGPLPKALALRTHEFVFRPYILEELGAIAGRQFLRHGYSIDLPFQLLIARFSQGNPKEAVSNAERLALRWRAEGMSENLGALIHHLNTTLEYHPEEPDQNFMAIWEERVFQAISAEQVVADLQEAGFPFGLSAQAPRSGLHFLAPNDRKARIAGSVISLPPFVFQHQIYGGGPVGGRLEAGQAKDLVFGAHAQVELEQFLEIAGFELVDAISRPDWLDGAPAIPEEVLALVWQRDQGRCASCGRRQDLAFDHIISLARGGSNTARNVRILCESCHRNRRKGHTGRLLMDPANE